MVNNNNNKERTQGAADDVNLVLDAVSLADSGALDHETNDVTTLFLADFCTSVSRILPV